MRSVRICMLTSASYLMTTVGVKSGLTAAGYAVVASAIPTVRNSHGTMEYIDRILIRRGLLTSKGDVALSLTWHDDAAIW